MGAHSSPAAGYKILYTKFLLFFDRGFRRCDILGGELILQLSFQLVCIHVSDVEAEVALFCPVSCFSATLASVGSGLGLSHHVYVHRNGVAWCRVGVGEACGGCGRQDGSRYCQRAVHGGSRDEHLSVGNMKSLICGAVLIHSDCKAEPGLGIRIQRSFICHSCQGRRDSAIKALAELDYDGFRSEYLES